MRRPGLLRPHTGKRIPRRPGPPWPSDLDIAAARRTVGRYAAFTAQNTWPPGLSKEQLALIADHQHDAAVILNAALERRERGQ